MSVQKRYTTEFKLQAVELCKLPGALQINVAKELGISNSTLHGWIRKYSPEILDGNLEEMDVTHCTDEDLKLLRRENKRLALENEILKKTVVIFSSPLGKDTLA